MKLIWHLKKFEELTAEELYKIIQLRINVFMIEQNCLYDECDGKDTKCFHLWATTEKDEIAAYSRIAPPSVSYKEASIGRVLTNLNFRKENLGKQLMEKSLSIAENLFHTKSCRISAQTYLIEFYKKFGFNVVSEEYLEDEIPHIEMLK